MRLLRYRVSINIRIFFFPFKCHFLSETIILYTYVKIIGDGCGSNVGVELSNTNYYIIIHIIIRDYKTTVRE